MSKAAAPPPAQTPSLRTPGRAPGAVSPRVPLGPWPAAGAAVARRDFLRIALGGAAVLVMPAGCADAPGAAGSSAGGRFLAVHEYETLRALAGVLIPEDEDPGAVTARVADYVDFLLGAFTVDPPRLYAAGPLSGRHGGEPRFDVYLPLSRVKEIGWRSAIEGSRGIAEREFNGPVVGLQETYRAGLAALDDLARAEHGRAFQDLEAAEKRRIVARADGDFVQTAFEHCAEGMYAAPEYGGNAELVGWEYIRYEGDRQPVGYSRREMEEADVDASPAARGASSAAGGSSSDPLGRAELEGLAAALRGAVRPRGAVPRRGEGPGRAALPGRGAR